MIDVALWSTLTEARGQPPEELIIVVNFQAITFYRLKLQDLSEHSVVKVHQLMATVMIAAHRVGTNRCSR